MDVKSRILFHVCRLRRSACFIAVISFLAIFRRKADQMESYALGIDIGTGSVKALAVDGRGSTLASAQEYYGQLAPAPGYAEQDPRQIGEHLYRCVRKITAELKGAPSVIGLSSYMHGLMAVGEDGTPLTNVLLWNDTRAASAASAVRASREAEALYL